MKETFLCVMAQYDEKTEMILVELQQHLIKAGLIGRQSKHLKHHITLGIFDIAHEEAIKVRIDEITRCFEPFEIRLGSLGLFQTEVLFIAPVANTALQQIHESLHQGIDEDPDWVPHSTLFIEETQSVLQATEILARQFQPFTARIESLSFYQFKPTRFILMKPLKPSK